YIVNWGPHAEGSGEALLQESEITDWRVLVVNLQANMLSSRITFPHWPAKEIGCPPDLREAARRVNDANAASVQAVAYQNDMLRKEAAADNAAILNPGNVELARIAKDVKAAADNAVQDAAAKGIAAQAASDDLDIKQKIANFLASPDAPLSSVAKKFIV